MGGCVLISGRRDYRDTQSSAPIARVICEGICFICPIRGMVVACAVISVLLPFCSCFPFVCCELKKHAPISVHPFDRVRRRIDVGGFDSPPLVRKGAMLDFSLAQLDMQVTIKVQNHKGEMSHMAPSFLLHCYVIGLLL